MKYPRILMSVMQQCWAMRPDKLAAMVDVLRMASSGERLALDEITRRIGAQADAEALQPLCLAIDAMDAKIAPQTANAVARAQGSVMVVPVHGVIANRASAVSNVSSGAGVSVERLTAVLRSGLANNDVKAIIMDLESPGGAVEGVQELADEIFANRGGKPIIAQVDAQAASAAYWLASAADEVVVTPSGEVGSIGVYTVHEDISEMLKAEGVVSTIVSAGKFKTELADVQPLSAEALAYLQSRVDSYYGMFAESVARGRGVKRAAVTDGFGQGRMVGAREALAEGMADRVATMAETLERFGVRLRTPAASARAETPRLKRAQRALKLVDATLG